MQGWEAWKARLRQGEVVTFGGKGDSMVPKIKSGEKCTYVAVLPRAQWQPGGTYLDPQDLKVGDMVWCHVGRWHFTHLLTAIRTTKGETQYQISNNHGHINGWIPASRIFGKVIRVGDREVT